jgi:hypothetical protein
MQQQQNKSGLKKKLVVEISYEDALEKYYKLKEKYENKKENVVDKIIKNKESTLKEKRRKFQRDMKCVKCGKSGGTIFSNENNTLRAYCGNSEQPCTLDISIKHGVYQNIRSMEEKYSKNIDALQNMIIKIKLNLLFGYASEETTLTEFNKYRDLLNEQAKEYRTIQTDFLRIVADPNTQAIIEEKENQIVELIDTLRQMQKDYLLKLPMLSEEQKNSFVEDIVDYYLTKIVPLNEEIVNLKYKTNELYLDLDEKNVIRNYVLAREPYTYKEMEILDETRQGQVLKFVQ